MKSIFGTLDHWRSGTNIFWSRSM